MIDAQQWLDQNYPFANRTNITDLDISNKDLRGPLAFGGFINLRKLNVSFNNLTEFYLVANDVLEDIDFSYNQLTFGATSWRGVCEPNMKKLNLSNNNIFQFDFLCPYNLTHLNFSNNKIVKLNLTLVPSQNLVELKCSDNPLTELLLNLSPNIVSFDCLGIKFDKSFTTYSTFSTPTFTTYSSLVSPTKTDNSDLTIGLGIL